MWRIFRDCGCDGMWFALEWIEWSRAALAGRVKILFFLLLKFWFLDLTVQHAFAFIEIQT